MINREVQGVAELQGLDGAFSFAERLLQRIWLRLDFELASARTSDGRRVKILFPGKWNRLGGPDFFGARLEIEGKRLEGDVELHLRASDWKAHGHPADPNYQSVILHVVLFPPKEEQLTFGVNGERIPILALLPLLHRSLEEYADEDAVEKLANHPLRHACEALLRRRPDELRAELADCARARWTEKCRIAQKRIERLGWADACHQTALEILGYRFNRGPMLSLAAEYPLPVWPDLQAAGGLDQILLVYSARWHRQAVRPANHPHARLRQYQRWTAAIRDWPSRLLENLPEETSETAAENLVERDPISRTARFRKEQKLAQLCNRIMAGVCGGEVGGTRFYTLLCDGFFPLLAAHRTAAENACADYWFHCWNGDVPDALRVTLRALGITDTATPLSHGLAQGLLGWIWRDEMRTYQTTAFQ